MSIIRKVLRIDPLVYIQNLPFIYAKITRSRSRRDNLGNKERRPNKIFRVFGVSIPKNMSHLEKPS
jgi:hypothetical protein